jgi:predicted metal-dependent peptidase
MSNNDTSNKQVNEKLKGIIGETDPKVDMQARDRLISARVVLLLKQAFFGNLATRLKLINADNWLPTLATDGRNFYYNSRFVMMLRDKEIQFGFGHEILHCVYDHFGRKLDRYHDLWNAANDYCVNADLVKHNVGEKITTIEILYDTKYVDWPSEKVYDDLLKNVKQIDMDELMKKMLDEHIQIDDGKGNGNGDGKGNGDGNNGSGKPSLTSEEAKQIRDEFREAVLNAANNEPNAGNIPGNVKQMIKELTEPKMDWRELLNTTLTSAIKDDYTWMRPSRRSWHTDTILPGMNPGETIDIAVAIDTSGSISETMLIDFLSEVQGAMESFTSYKIHLFCFDTKTHNPVEYTSDNINSITEYELGGFGGTAFEPIFDHLKDQDIMPERLVVFTDGYPYGSWGDENYCDTLWVVHGSGHIEAPFGVTVHYEEHIRDQAA